MSETLSDRYDLLAFRDRVNRVMAEVKYKESQEPYGFVSNDRWAEIRNYAACVLPSELRLIGLAAEFYLKWRVGYDESTPLQPLLSLFSTIGNALIGHWGGRLGPPLRE
jgi:hypothetical protein